MFQTKFASLAVVASVFASISLALPVSAQTIDPPEIEWEKAYEEKGYESGNAIQETSDGKYIVAGRIKSFGAGDYDVYLVKIDSQGNKIWGKVFNVNEDDFVFSVREAFDGGYIILILNDSSWGENVYLIKTDKNGNKLWEKTYGGEADDVGYSLHVAVDGGYAVTGYTNSLGNKTSTYLFKTDQNGNLQWERNISLETSLIDEGTSCYQTQDEGYIVTGWMEQSRGVPYVYLVKTDFLGNIEWQKIIGDNNSEGRAVQQTKDRGYIILGTKKIFEPGYICYLIKTDSFGNVVWEKTFGEAQMWGVSVQQTTDDGYILIAGQQIPLSPSLDGFSLFKTDVLGNLVWEKMFSGVNQGVGYNGYSVRQTTDEGYIAVGNILFLNGDVSNIYLVKLKPELPPSPSQFLAQLRTERSVGVSWRDNSQIETQFILERRIRARGEGDGGAQTEDNYQEIAQIPANTTQYIDGVVPPDSEVTYKISAVNSNGSSPKVTSDTLTTPKGRNQLKLFKPDMQGGQWVDLKLSSQFNSSLGTAVIVHGWQPFPGTDPLNTWVKDLARAIFARENNLNILAWEWIREATGRDLPEGSRPVYDQIELLYNSLKQIISSSYNKPLHFMGHSAGSYIVVRVCKKFFGLDPKEPKEFPQVQVTLFDPADVGLLFNLTTEVNLLRANKIYTDLYHGFFSLGTHNVNLWVNAPGISHSTYGWYKNTIPRGKTPILWEKPNYLLCTGDTINGDIGFGASTLIAPTNDPNFYRVKNRACDESGTYRFSKLSLCSLAQIPGQIFELENPNQCPSIQNPTSHPPQDLTEGTFWNDEIFQTNFQHPNTTEAIIGIGKRGQGGGAGVKELAARYTLDLLIMPEWDYLSFEYDFLSAPAPSVLEVALVDGDTKNTIFVVNSEAVFNENYQETGLWDIRELHGKTVRFQLDLRSGEPNAEVGMRNLTFWHNQKSENTPPQAHAGEDQTLRVSCNGLAQITLDGSLTTDPDPDEILEYSWIVPEGMIARGVQPTVELPAGEYTITLAVRDSAENVSSDEVKITINSEPCPFRRGDSNGDETIDISDAINTLGYLFTGAGDAPCMDASDANDDGIIDISDAVFTLGFLFLGTREPPLPFPQRGYDETEDILDCRKYPLG